MARSLAAGCLLSTVLLLLLISLRSQHVSSSVVDHAAANDARVRKLVSDWEPELYAELGQHTPQWIPGLKNLCVRDPSQGLRCVPTVLQIGNWQSNAKGLAALVGAHPNISSVGNDRCFQSLQRWVDHC